MATLYRHQRDGTYYTRLYRGGIVTRQIHPDGVAILKRDGVALDHEIPAHLISFLESRGLLYTKEEVYGWGAVDWAPEWNSIGTTSNHVIGHQAGTGAHPIGGTLPQALVGSTSRSSTRVPRAPKPLLSPEAEWPLGVWIAALVALGWLTQSNVWLGRAGLIVIVAFKLYGGVRQAIPILQADSSHLMPWSDRATELREDLAYQRERKLVVIVLLTIFCIIGFLARDNAFDWLGALVTIPAIWTMFEVWRLRNV